MIQRVSPVLLPGLLLLLLLQACGSKVAGPASDIEAPRVTILQPALNDSLAADTLTVLLDVQDNVGITRVEVSIDNATQPAATLTAPPWQAALDVANLADGQHSIIAYAWDAAGNRSAVAATPVRKGGGGTVEEVPRVSLAEITTSANCAPCGAQNARWHEEQTGNQVFQDRVATIKYHVWWPRPTDILWKQSQEWSRPRTQYLFSPLEEAQYSAPSGWIAGVRISAKATDWIGAANVDLTKKAKAKITLEYVKNGDAINLTIKVKGLATAGYSDLRLHTVVTEDDIEYNDGNSEYIHYDVMRQMYPNASGEAVTIPNGIEATYTRDIAISSNWNPIKLKAVVFLQSNDSKEVLQTAKIHF
jgi:hypothetical protein